MSKFTSSQPTVKLPPSRPPVTPRSQQVNLPLILVAIAIALLTVIGTNWYILRLKRTIATDTVTLYRLKVRADPGDTLKRKNLETIQVPSALKDTYITDLQAVDTEGLKAFVGTKFAQPARQGQLLTVDLLLGGAASKRIEPAKGKRAITLPISREGAPPILDPMTYVDISVIVTPRGQRTQSMLVMERVKVLAVGNRTSITNNARRPRNYNNITVEVTPEEAQQLATIQQYAADQKFSIVIRNPTDNNVQLYAGGINPELLRALNLPVLTNTRTN